MDGIIWALEIHYDGKWTPTIVEKAWNNPSLRSFFEQYRDEDPSIPRRIKAYRRYSDVVEQQQAEGPESKWPKGSESARIYKLDIPGSPAQTVGPGSTGRGGAIVLTLYRDA